LLGPTVGVAVFLAVSALIVWGVALWFSWGGECPSPSAQSEGLSKGADVWPPAARCIDPQGNAFWHQALPWAPWVIGFLVIGAAAILLTGLLVAIRDLRRPAPVAVPRSLELLQASFPGDRPSGGEHAEAAPAERDPSAIAA